MLSVFKNGLQLKIATSMSFQFDEDFHILVFFPRFRRVYEPGEKVKRTKLTGAILKLNSNGTAQVRITDTRRTVSISCDALLHFGEYDEVKMKNNIANSDGGCRSIHSRATNTKS